MAKLQKACPWISNTNFSAVNLKHKVKKRKCGWSAPCRLPCLVTRLQKAEGMLQL